MKGNLFFKIHRYGYQKIFIETLNSEIFKSLKSQKYYFFCQYFKQFENIETNTNLRYSQAPGASFDANFNMFCNFFYVC